MEVENHHFIVAEVRNFEALVQNEGLDPIGIYIYETNKTLCFDRVSA